MEMEKELQQNLFKVAKHIVSICEDNDSWVYTTMILKTNIGDVGIVIENMDDKYGFMMIDADKIFNICPDFTEEVMREDRTGGYMQFTADWKKMLSNKTFSIELLGGKQ